MRWKRVWRSKRKRFLFVFARCGMPRTRWFSELAQYCAQSCCVWDLSEEMKQSRVRCNWIESFANNYRFIYFRFWKCCALSFSGREKKNSVTSGAHQHSTVFLPRKLWKFEYPFLRLPLENRVRSFCLDFFASRRRPLVASLKIVLCTNVLRPFFDCILFSGSATRSYKVYSAFIILFNEFAENNSLFSRLDSVMSTRRFDVVWTGSVADFNRRSTLLSRLSSPVQCHGKNRL